MYGPDERLERRFNPVIDGDDWLLPDPDNDHVGEDT